MGELNKFAPLEGGTYEDVVLDNTPEQIGTSPKLYSVEVENSANTVKSVIHIWDKSGVPTFGTHEPDWIYTVAAGERVTIPFEQDGLLGDQFTNEMWIAATTGTNVNTAPTNTVLATIKTDGT